MRRCALLSALCVALVAPTVATAAPRPDLRVLSVRTGSTQEAPNSLLTATVRVVNSGRGAARATRLGLYLSLDRRKGRGDFRLRPRPRVSARRPRSRLRMLRTYRVPAGVPAGDYALVACADDTRRVRERRERNNCRSAARRIRIVVPVPGLPAPLPPTTEVVTGPVSLRVTGPPNGSVTFDSTPSYSGTARSGTGTVERVEVSIDGGSYGTAGVSCSGCGTASASWTFSPASPLPDGAHSLGFRAIDDKGRSSGTITRTLTVDTTAPTFGSVAATAGSNLVAATFSEPLACITVNAFDFTAQVGGAPVTVTNVGCSAGSNVVALALGAVPTAGQIVTVTLTGVLSDPAGNVAPRPTARSDGA